MSDDAVFCSACGRPVPRADRFCSACGSAQEADAVPESESLEELSDEQAVAEMNRQEEAALGPRAAQLPEGGWLPLSPDDRRTLSWRRLKRLPACVIELALAAAMAFLIYAVLTGPKMAGPDRGVAIVFCLVIAGVGVFALLMLRANAKEMAGLSADLRDNGKEVFEAYVSAMWSHQAHTPRRSSVRIFGGPLATRGTRFYAELRRRSGGASVKQEYEISRRLYNAVNAKQRVRAEVAPHSQVVLLLARV
jgi:hypothetical protein